jgi:uncharacterized protein (TIGR03435 family)
MPKLLTVLLLIPLTLAACNTGRAQQAASSRPLHFDVVSVRESKPNPDGSYSMRSDSDVHNSHLGIMNLSRLDLIGEAFDLRSSQIEGLAGLPWAIYTIHASSDEDTDAVLKAMTNEEARRARQQMLQEILVERFHLRYHFVTREMPSYLLVVDKQPKLRLSAVKPLPPGEPERPDDPASPGITWHCGHPGCSINARGQTMEKLAEIFVGYMQAPVIDRTNLPGLWDFSLQWWAPMMSINGTPTDDSYPQPEDAFAHQLGLKLERGKAPMKILIVDNIERPTQN